MKSKEEKFVPIDKMIIVPTCQRRLNPRRVNDIVATFDADLLRQFVVSHRDNGDMVLLDGQHRRAAIVQMLATGRTDAPNVVKCEVFTGLTEIEEGRLFLGFNNAVVPPWADKFVVRLTANDTDAHNILAVLDKYGWQAQNRSTGNAFRALYALEQVYHLSNQEQVEPNLADTVVGILTDAWGYEPTTVHTTMIQGLAAFLIEYAKLGYTIDPDRLVKKMGEYGAPISQTRPQAFLAQARNTARLMKASPPMGVAAVLRTLYNENKHHRQALPPWDRLR